MEGWPRSGYNWQTLKPSPQPLLWELLLLLLLLLQMLLLLQLLLLLLCLLLLLLLLFQGPVLDWQEPSVGQQRRVRVCLMQAAPQLLRLHKQGASMLAGRACVG